MFKRDTTQDVSPRSPTSSEFPSLLERRGASQVRLHSHPHSQPDHSLRASPKGYKQIITTLSYHCHTPVAAQAHNRNPRESFNHVAVDAHAVPYGRLLVGGDPFGDWTFAELNQRSFLMRRRHSRSSSSIRLSSGQFRTP